MAASKLKLLLYNSRGEETLRLAYAKSFEIYYGKKKIVPQSEFKATWKKPYKERFLDTLLIQLEADYYFEAQVRKQERKEVKKVLSSYELYSKRPKAALIKQERAKKFERIIETFTDKENKVREREVLVEHLKTASPLYTKQFIHKIVTSGKFDGNYLDLVRMNFTLKHPIEVTEHNYFEMMELMYFYFYPHLADFYRRSRNTEKWFIFRIKYSQDYITKQKKTVTVYEGGKKKKKKISTDVLNSGVGFMRFKPNSLESYMNFIQQTYEMMLSDSGETGSLVGYLRRKFVKSTFITGFSIEVIKRIIKVGI